MKMTKKKIHWITAVIIAFVMSVFMFTEMITAKAADGSIDTTTIDKTAKGSITVTKYASSDVNADKKDATGTAADSRGIDGSYKTLAGATFKLFKIADADAVMTFYDGSDDSTYDLQKFSYNGTTASYNGVDIAASDTYEGTTAADGTYTFHELPVGSYVLKEITAPSQVSAPLAEESLISIPMVNTDTSNNDGTKWLYDVYVYPKNHESTGNIELTKVDQSGQLLSNVVFELYKNELNEDGSLSSIDWTPVKNTVDNTGHDVPLDLKTGTNGIMNIESLPAGLYGTQYKLVEVYKDGTSPEGYIINSNPLYFQVKNNTVTWNGTADGNGCSNINSNVVGTPALDPDDSTTLQITLKNEVPSFSKKVQENDGTAWKQDEQYRLDDTITYKLTAYVPSNVGELDRYEIVDSPESGITYDSVVSVKYGKDENNCTTALDAKDYKVTATADRGFSYTFTNKSTAAAGKYIEIIYTAHMNSDAVIAGNGNGNKASLTYSKTIGGNGEYVISDEARVYTYQYEITKHLDRADGAVAGGVEFNLLYSEDGDPVKVVEEQAGIYRLALANENGTITTLRTADNGTLLIKGLENGDYYLKETKTVANYNLLSKPVKITVNVKETTTWTAETLFNSTSKVMKNFESVSYNVNDAKGISTIVNKKGFTLPKTGSMGFILFCVLGLALIAGGAMLIFGGKKTKKIR